MKAGSRYDSSSFSRDGFAIILSNPGIIRSRSRVSGRLKIASSPANPVATTVIFTSSSSLSSIIAPKIIFACGSEDLVMICAASLISCIVRSRLPETANKMPFAPSIETSKSGESIAVFAAICALFSPLPLPMPISADPAPCIIALTSAKSRLMSPGTVISSEIPCTP